MNLLLKTIRRNIKQGLRSLAPNVREHKTIDKQGREGLKESAFESSPFSSVLGTLIIILAGIFLNSDLIIFHLYPDFVLNNLYGWDSSQDLIWIVSQALAPILLIIGSLFRPYIFSYAVPLYFYIMQLQFTFDADVFDNQDYFNFIAGGTAVFIFLVTYQLYRRLSSVKAYYVLESSMLKAKIERLETRLKKYDHLKD